MNESEIFIHLGLPKTGTTYLQENIFSKFNKGDISYLGKAKNISVWDIMEMPSNKYLISSEHLLANPFTCEKGMWFQNFKSNLIKLHEKFPNAKYIISLRNHKSLILSYYKEHISKGNRKIYPSLEQFFDIENNQGQVVKEDFYFKEIIQQLELVSNEKPFVFFQESLRKEPNHVVKSLENFLQIPSQNIKLMDGKKTNVGVDTKKAKLLINLNKVNQQTNRFGLNLYNKYFFKYGLTPDYIVRQRLSWLKDTPLKFPEDMQLFIEDKYRGDMFWVKEYISQQNFR
jgi:hypothetical protein